MASSVYCELDYGLVGGYYTGVQLTGVYTTFFRQKKPITIHEFQKQLKINDFEILIWN